MKKIIILFLILSNSVFTQINFEKGSLTDVMSKAKAQNKNIMIDVMTEWCKWCVELDNKVYSKPEVYEYANANLINYKIDAEKGEGIEFAKKYKIAGFPSILFLDSDGNEIDRIYGYVPASDFLEMMTDYNKGINTFSYLQKEAEANPNNLNACFKLADKYMMYGENDKAKALYEKIIETDPNNTQGITDDAKLRLISFKDKNDKPSAYEKFIAENNDSDLLKDAYLSISETYFYELNNLDEAEKWYKEVLSKFPNDEFVNSSYGQFLNQRAAGLAENGTTVEDFNKGLSFIETALQYVAGSVNEASSYFIQSKIYFKLKDYNKALESVNKALKIFDRKLFREHKEKIEKQLSENTR